jgi:hypothetical protein
MRLTALFVIIMLVFFTQGLLQHGIRPDCPAEILVCFAVPGLFFPSYHKITPYIKVNQLSTYTAVISVSGPTNTCIAATPSGRVVSRQGNLVDPGPHNRWKCGVPLLVARYTVTHNGALYPFICL